MKLVTMRSLIVFAVVLAGCNGLKLSKVKATLKETDDSPDEVDTENDEVKSVKTLGKHLVGEDDSPDEVDTEDDDVESVKPLGKQLAEDDSPDEVDTEDDDVKSVKPLGKQLVEDDSPDEVDTEDAPNDEDDAAPALIQKRATLHRAPKALREDDSGDADPEEADKDDGGESKDESGDKPGAEEPKEADKDDGVTDESEDSTEDPDADKDDGGKATDESGDSDQDPAEADTDDGVTDESGDKPGAEDPDSDKEDGGEPKDDSGDGTDQPENGDSGTEVDDTPDDKDDDEDKSAGSKKGMEVDDTPDEVDTADDAPKPKTCSSCVYKESQCGCGPVMEYLNCVAELCHKATDDGFAKKCVAVKNNCANDVNLQCRGPDATCAGKFNQLANGHIGLEMVSKGAGNDGFCGPNGKCLGKLRLSATIHHPAPGVMMTCGTPKDATKADALERSKADVTKSNKFSKEDWTTCTVKADNAESASCDVPMFPSLPAGGKAYSFCVLTDGKDGDWLTHPAWQSFTNVHKA